MSTYDSIEIPVIRRMMPNLISDQIIGVQPLAEDIAGVYHMHRYPNDPSDEYTDLTEENEDDMYMERIGINE